MMDKDVLKKAIQKSKYNPDWFCERILRMPNDPWQSEGMNAIADLFRIKKGIPTLYNHKGLNRFSVVAFHGPGKTHWMAKLMHWFNFVVKARIPCTAPKENQVVTRLWPEFRKILNNAIAEYRTLIDVEAKKIIWGGDLDHCALIEAANQPDNLQGLHDKYLMFLVEEASGVNEQMFPVIEGSLTDNKEDGINVMVLIGNPVRSSGEFWASHKKRGVKELYYRISIKPEDSKRISKEWVNGMILKYGRNSPVVKTRVFGEFVDSEENQLISLDWVEDSCNRELKDLGEIPVLKISCDVSDGGEDETVITVARHYDSFIHFIKMKRFSFEMSVAPIEAAEAIINIAESYNFDKNNDIVIVDSIGVGAGTAGTLIKKGYNVIQYKGGEASSDSKQWRNKRVQSYIAFRNALRDGDVIIDDNFCDKSDWDDVFAQLSSIKINPNSDKLEDLMTKQQMKSEGIKSPDIADSMAMHFSNKQPYISGSSFEIITSKSKVSDW